MKGELRQWPAGSFSPAILLHSSPSIDALGCIPRSRRSSVGERRLLENLFLAITLVNPIPKQSNLYRYWAIPSCPNAMAQASFETQWIWIWTGNRLAWLWGSNRIVELMTIASYGAFVTPRQTGFKRGVITAAVNTSQRVRFFLSFFEFLFLALTFTYEWVIWTLMDPILSAGFFACCTKHAFTTQFGDDRWMERSLSFVHCICIATTIHVHLYLMISPPVTIPQKVNTHKNKNKNVRPQKVFRNTTMFLLKSSHWKRFNFIKIAIYK